MIVSASSKYLIRNTPPHIACRAGEIFSCERSHHKKFYFHLQIFRCKTGERKKVLPRGWTIGKRKDTGGSGAKKISPAWGHCSFRKLRLPTNRVSDWCGSTLSVNNCLSITSQIIRFVRQRNTANSVESGVVSWIPLSRNLLTFYVNLDTSFGKSLIFQTFLLIKPTMTGNGFERGCCVNLPGN